MYKKIFLLSTMIFFVGCANTAQPMPKEETPPPTTTNNHKAEDELVKNVKVALEEVINKDKTPVAKIPKDLYIYYKGMQRW